MNENDHFAKKARDNQCGQLNKKIRTGNVPEAGRAAREPTMEEWGAAEVWNLTLTQDIPASGGDYRY